MSRSILITGSSRGIGRALAEHFRDQGWQVFAGVRDESQAPAGTTPVSLDITSEADLQALPGKLPAKLDVVVNNAGAVVAGPLETVRPEDLRTQLDVNVVGQLAVTQAVLPLIRAAGGRVVFISSLSGKVSTPTFGAYCTSKFALEGMIDALRVELRPWRIPVVSVLPGAIDTDLWRQAPDTIDGVVAGMSTEHRELYTPSIKAAAARVGVVQRLTSPTSAVVKSVDKAVTRRRPRSRYLVGVDAKAQARLTSLTPQPIVDAVLAKAFGFGRATS